MEKILQEIRNTYHPIKPKEQKFLQGCLKYEG